MFRKPVTFVIWQVVLWVIAVGGMLNAGGDCDGNSAEARIVLYTVFLVVWTFGSVLNFQLNGANE